MSKQSNRLIRQVVVPLVSTVIFLILSELLSGGRGSRVNQLFLRRPWPSRTSKPSALSACCHAATTPSMSAKGSNHTGVKNFE